MKTKKKKKQIFYTCGVCGKQAVYNLQNIWKLWEIIKDKSFEELKEWEGDSNEFFCEKCYNKEMSETN